MVRKLHGIKGKKSYRKNKYLDDEGIRSGMKYFSIASKSWTERLINVIFLLLQQGKSDGVWQVGET